MIDKLLLIPDAHSMPNVPQHRFEILGEYAAAKQFSHIVCLGDWADMPSLSLWDLHKRKSEGQRYSADIKAAREAQELFFKPIHKLNIQNKREKKPLYTPKLHMLYGNHEFRIERATENDPKLHGALCLDDLGYEEFGWTTHPFLKPLILEGVGFNHFWPGGLMERPISGNGAALRMTQIDGQSKVSGHSHLLQIAHEGRGRSRYGLVAGCILDPKTQINGSAMSYVSPYTRSAWWNGILVLHGVHQGTFHPVMVPYEYLLKRFA